MKKILFFILLTSLNGKCYESTINANVWSPTAYPAGWKEIQCP